MLSSAPIFLKSHYFRQNIWPWIIVQFHFLDVFVDEMTDAHYRRHNALITLLLKAAALDMSPFYGRANITSFLDKNETKSYLAHCLFIREEQGHPPRRALSGRVFLWIFSMLVLATNLLWMNFTSWLHFSIDPSVTVRLSQSDSEVKISMCNKEVNVCSHRLTEDFLASSWYCPMSWNLELEHFVPLAV